MNTIYFLVQQTMLFSIPLLLVALGGMFSERSGVVNIALEGIMIMGAFTGIFFINKFSSYFQANITLFLAIFIAMITGILFSLLHAYASINMSADQIISATSLNIFAPAFAIYVTRAIQGIQQINFINNFRIDSVFILGKIPVIGDLFFKNTYITTYLGIFILFLSRFILFKTRFGLRLRSCGENPHAADSVGINVYKIRYIAVSISGALAGVGGLIFIIPTSTNFNATVTGYGFLALAVLIFGQWNPLRIFYASLFFGLMKTISASYSVIPILSSLSISNQIYKMIPYIATIFVLSFTSKSSQSPKALGVPYDKSVR